MNKKEIEEIVSNKLTNDLNFNEMQIRHETITDITNKCGTIQPCIIAMQPIVDWFNSKKTRDQAEERARALCYVLREYPSLQGWDDSRLPSENWRLT